MNSFLKYLQWDGIYRTSGSLNHTPVLPVVPIVPVEEVGEGKNEALVRKGSHEEAKLLNTVDKPVIGVRIRKVDAQIRPFEEALAIRIRLYESSPNLIRSLVLRIYRSYDPITDTGDVHASKLVYQECLNRAQIDQLPEEDPTRGKGGKKPNPKEGPPLNPMSLLDLTMGSLKPALMEPPERKRDSDLYGYGNGSIHVADSPYKVVVWVSLRENKFSEWKPGAAPQALEVTRNTRQDQSRSRHKKIPAPPADARGLNLTAAAPLPLIRFAAVTPCTGSEATTGRFLALRYKGELHLDRLNLKKLDTLKTFAGKKRKDVWQHPEKPFVAYLQNCSYYPDGTVSSFQDDFWVDGRWESQMRFLFEQLERLYSNDTTVKAAPLAIILAPEWYFSRCILNGDETDPNVFPPYAYDEVQQIIGTLCDASKAYPNALLIPGTILWATPLKMKKHPKRYAIINTAVAIKNGDVVHLYHKKSHGGDDRATTQFVLAPPNTPEGVKLTTQEAPYLPEEIRNALKEASTSFFYCDGISFAFEICADHGQAVGQARREYVRRFPDGRGADVHIHVGYASHTIVETTTVPRQGGFHLNCDGQQSVVRSPATQTIVNTRVITQRNGSVANGGAALAKCREMVGIDGFHLPDPVPVAAAPPEKPADGDSFLIGANPTGAWAGQESKIASWNAKDGVWTFDDLADDPSVGDLLNNVLVDYNLRNDFVQRFDRTNVKLGSAAVQKLKSDLTPAVDVVISQPGERPTCVAIYKSPFDLNVQIPPASPNRQPVHGPQ